MAATAICPGYLTGIFFISKGDAAGAGFAVDRFMKTKVASKNSGSTTITINGKSQAAPVSRSVLGRFSDECGGVGSLRIEHSAQLPIGFGLGMSGAGALSLSLALNGLLGCGLSRVQCVKIAHDADVECGTGLSGVDAAAVGGILARRSVKELPVLLPFEKHALQLAFFSPINTASIIRSPGWKKKVNAAGGKALGMLFSGLGWNGLMKASRNFALASGLADWCKGEMAKNRRASMAMVGRTLFSDSPMKLSKKPMALIRANTYEGKAELLD